MISKISSHGTRCFCQAAAFTSILLTQPVIAGQPEPCTQIILPNATISRQQLSDFINLAQGSDKGQVQAVLGPPYCKLSTIPEAGLERDAYPLRFDPETWLVVRYLSGKTYYDYDFTFHNGR
jgi:hypothetical protein